LGGVKNKGEGPNRPKPAELTSWCGPSNRTKKTANEKKKKNKSQLTLGVIHLPRGKVWKRRGVSPQVCGGAGKPTRVLTINYSRPM